MMTPPLDPSIPADACLHVGPRAAVRNMMFGKRLQPPEREVSYRRERLRIIGAELNLLLAYRIEAPATFAHLREDGEPALVLGKSIGLALTVEIEPQAGHLVLYEESGRNECVLVTASEERLLDQIVGVISSANGELAPRTADSATDVLVGRTIDEVERRLVLHTLLHFRGDRRQTAFSLGIDEATLRAKLRRCFSSKWRGLASSEEPQ